MANEQLKHALREANLTAEELADELAVDPKTVERWLAGRLPYPRHRFRIARRLDRHEADLWIELAPPVVELPVRDRDPEPDELGDETFDDQFVDDDDEDEQNDEDDEVLLHPRVAFRRAPLLIPQRWADLPDWRQLARTAQHTIVMSGFTLADVIETSRDIDLLRNRLDDRCAISIILSDPDSIQLRLADTTPGWSFTPGESSPNVDAVKRVRALLEPLVGDNGIWLAEHADPPGYTIIRIDNQILARLHLHGVEPDDQPAMRLTADTDRRLFTAFDDHIDAISEHAVSVED